MFFSKQIQKKFTLKDKASTSIRNKVDQIISIVGQKQFYLKFAGGPDTFQQSQFSLMPQLYLQILLNIENWPLKRYPEYLYCQNYQQMNQPKLLFCISHINFEKLTYLNLQNQFIESLEPLGWLSIPEVYSIHLQRNWLTKLKQFSKVNYKKLRDISISQNHFQPDQIDYLMRMGYYQDYLYSIRLTNAQVNIFQVLQPQGFYQQRYCQLSSKINAFAKMAPVQKKNKLKVGIKNDLIEDWSVFQALENAKVGFENNYVISCFNFRNKQDSIQYKTVRKYPKKYQKIN